MSDYISYCAKQHNLLSVIIRASSTTILIINDNGFITFFTISVNTLLYSFKNDIHIIHCRIPNGRSRVAFKKFKNLFFNIKYLGHL